MNDLELIALVAPRDNAALARPPPIQLALNVGLR